MPGELLLAGRTQHQEGLHWIFGCVSHDQTETCLLQKKALDIKPSFLHSLNDYEENAHDGEDYFYFSRFGLYV